MAKKATSVSRSTTTRTRPRRTGATPISSCSVCVKATLAGAPTPYTADELDAIAAHCTEMENAARKVERTMRKVVAATLLERRVGETFDAIVTGVNQSGTFARLDASARGGSDRARRARPRRRRPRAREARRGRCREGLHRLRASVIGLASVTLTSIAPRSRSAFGLSADALHRRFVAIAR